MRVVSFLVAGPWLADAFFSFAPPTAVAANTRRPVNSGTRIHTGHGSGSLGRAGAVPGAAAAESESPESLLASSEGVAGAEAPEQITVEGGGAAESESPDSLPASLDGIAGAEALESSTIKGAESTRPDWWAEDAGVDGVFLSFVWFCLVLLCGLIPGPIARHAFWDLPRDDAGSATRRGRVH